MSGRLRSMATTRGSCAAAAGALLAVAMWVQLLTSTTPMVSAVRAAGLGGRTSTSRLLLQAATCDVTANGVAAAFDAYRSGEECSAFSTTACCTYFVEDLAYSDTGDSDGVLPAFAETCRTRVREVGQNGLCRLVKDQPSPYGVLQPLLDRCDNLRAPCVSPPPRVPCDTSVDTVNRAVSAAYDALRACRLDGFSRQCTDEGLPYECPQSGLCGDGSRCSFAPTRGAEIACCKSASTVLFKAIPCLSTCEIYRISREANNFLTVCQDVSRC